MNLTQIKCLLAFSVFAIIGFGPISPGCLIGMYIVVMRPKWFLEIIRNMYANLPLFHLATSVHTIQQSTKTRIKYFLSLLGLFILDIAPIPVTPVVASIIILSRPKWFYLSVLTIYGES